MNKKHIISHTEVYGNISAFAAYILNDPSVDRSGGKLYRIAEYFSDGQKKATLCVSVMDTGISFVVRWRLDPYIGNNTYLSDIRLLSWTGRYLTDRKDTREITELFSSIINGAEDHIRKYLVS